MQLAKMRGALPRYELAVGRARGDQVLDKLRQDSSTLFFKERFPRGAIELQAEFSARAGLLFVLLTVFVSFPLPPPRKTFLNFSSDSSPGRW